MREEARVLKTPASSGISGGGFQDDSGEHFGLFGTRSDDPF